MRNRSLARRFMPAAALLAGLPMLHGPAAAQEAVQAGGYDISVPIVPIVQNGSYSAGNALGGLQTIPIFRGKIFPSGVWNGIWAAWKGGNTTGVTIYVFDTQPSAGTTCTDKTALTLAAADIAKLAFAPINITAMSAFQGSTFAIAESIQVRSIRNGDSPLTNNIYVCAVVNGTVTPSSTADFVLKISGVIQD
jgi:hypothetical protein